MDLPDSPDLNDVQQFAEPDVPEAAPSKSEGTFAKNIVLTGIAGSGKSTVGRHLAVILGFGFLDLDQFIERSTGKSIARIFQDEGEQGFRSREAQALERIAQIKSHVVALGGGTLQSEHALNLAKRLGPIVWLKPSADEVAKRLYLRPEEIEKRPLFKEFSSIADKDERRAAIREKVALMSDSRSEIYQAADVVLDGGYVTPETSACQLKDILSSMGLVASILNRFGAWHKNYG